MSSMADAIIPKSDQLNSDDLIAGPITITVSKVDIRGGQEQPVSIHFEGDNGKPYKPCKSMSRVLVTAWGADAKEYVGRAMTLYRDPSVKWAGMEVGGIRISHMSDIDGQLTMALTATKGSRKPFTVRPLKTSTPAPAQESSKPSESPVTSQGDGRGVEDLEELIARGEKEADWGAEQYARWWETLTKAERKAIGADEHARMKAISTKDRAEGRA